MRPLLIGILCVLLSGVAPTQAQAQPLTLNESVEGALSTGASDTYAFIAREGQLMSFVARSTGTLDPVLSIQNLSGTTILQNDDYAYPDSLDAIIEGFVAPYTGSYSVTVSGYGATSGDYTLEMLSGYSTVVMRETFDGTADWQAIESEQILPAQVNAVNGTLNVIQEGIDEIALAIGVDADEPAYSVRIEVDSITDNAGWRAGLVFGYVNPDNFYKVLVNYRGAWRISAVEAGNETVLRDWNVHPAITPGTVSFSLGVLVNGTAFDIFYDGQYIGNAADPAYRGGQIGVVAETVESIGSAVTARFDNLTITVPTEVRNETLFPERLIANGMNSTIRELEQRLVIPAGGEMTFTLSESFAQNNRAGVSRFPVGDGRSASNFAIGARVSWVASVADLNGCGLVVRDDGADNYVLAYVDSTGGFGLSERSGDAFAQNLFNTHENISRPPHDMLLILRDEQVHYFLNGYYVGSLTVDNREGTIAEAVVNFDAVNTNCQFNNLWMWQW